MSTKTAEILRNAAGRIQTFGWCQGSGTDSSGRCCIQQAIGWESKSSDNFRHATRAVTQYLGWDAPLFMWNDRVGCKQEDVVRALLETAAVEESR